MREKYLPAITLLGVIVGASGLGLGAFTMMQVQTGAVNGDDGDDGDDGIFGEKGDDGIVDLVVVILEPDNGETVWGNITIGAFVQSGNEYTVSILLNGSEIGTTLPLVWNASTVAEGWWNITVIATDVTTNDVSQDEVVVKVKDSRKSRVRGRVWSTQDIDQGVVSTIDWGRLVYDEYSDFNLTTDRFIAPKDGYYVIYASVIFTDLVQGDNHYIHIKIRVQGTVWSAWREYIRYTVWGIQISDTVWVNEGEYLDFRILLVGTGGKIVGPAEGGGVFTYFTIEEL